MRTNSLTAIALSTWLMLSPMASYAKRAYSTYGTKTQEDVQIEYEVDGATASEADGYYSDWKFLKSVENDATIKDALLTLAEGGDTTAMFKLACMYYHGKGAERDFAEALKWNKAAGFKGHAQAQNNLGYMFQEGKGVKKSLPDALKWYQTAAKFGCPQAQCNLAFMYETGLGIPKDMKEATNWYQKSSDQGDALAKRNLYMIQFDQNKTASAGSNAAASKPQEPAKPVVVAEEPKDPKAAGSQQLTTILKHLTDGRNEAPSGKLEDIYSRLSVPTAPQGAPPLPVTEARAQSTTTEVAMAPQTESAQVKAAKEAAAKAEATAAAAKAARETAAKAEAEAKIAAAKAAKEAAAQAERDAAQAKADRLAAVKAEKEAALKATQEAAAKDAAQKAEREAAAKAEKEAAIAKAEKEKSAKEAALKAEREAAAKAEKEAALAKAEKDKADREAAAAKAKAENEAAIARAEKEKLEKEAAAKAEKEALAKAEAEKAEKAAALAKAEKERLEKEAAATAEREAALAKAKQEVAAKASAAVAAAKPAAPAKPATTTVAQDQTDTTTDTQTNFARPIRDKWALVVGISKFQSNEIPHLRYSAKDASDFYNYLVKEAGFAPDHVRLLLDEKATLRRVMSELGTKFLARVAKPDDLVVLFFSTHGSPSQLDIRGKNYLVAHDSDPHDLFSTGVEMQKIVESIQGRVLTDRVLLVLDACHSGFAGPNAKGMARAGNFDATELAQGSGQLVLCSSQPSEQSWESTRYQNGIFTRQLLQGLRSKGKQTSLVDAYNFTKKQVADEVREDRAGVRQTPVLKGKWSGNDLIVAVPAAAPQSVPTAVKAELEQDSAGDLSGRTSIASTAARTSVMAAMPLESGVKEPFVGGENTELNLSSDYFKVDGDPRQLLPEYAAAFKANPRNPAELFYLRAKAYIQLKEWQNALSDIGNAVQLAPNQPSYYLARAYIYQKMGRAVLSREDLEQARFYDPRIASKVTFAE